MIAGDDSYAGLEPEPRGCLCTGSLGGLPPRDTLAVAWHRQLSCWASDPYAQPGRAAPVHSSLVDGLESR